MRTKLRTGELCPLHNSRNCVCHGEKLQTRQLKARRGPVTRIEYPPGSGHFREECTPAELRRRKHILLKRDPTCFACGVQFKSYDEVELAHLTPKGMNGWKRDDSWSQLVLMHRDENREQGSRTMEAYLEDPKRIGLNRSVQT